MMFNAAFVCTQLFFLCLKLLLYFPSALYNLTCVCVALPPHWARMFVCLCSQKGLKNVFDEAILAALEPPEPKKKRKCVLLWEGTTFPKHAHAHTYTHTHTQHIHPKYMHTRPHPSPAPTPLSLALLRLIDSKQPTKFQIIVCNNKTLHPQVWVWDRRST